MPKATETFKDSLLPFIGISKIVSAVFSTEDRIPFTSLPTTRQIFLFRNFDFGILLYGIDFFDCSSAKIAYPSRFNFFITWLTKR